MIVNIRERCEELLDDLYPYSAEDEDYQPRLEELESFAREIRNEALKDAANVLRDEWYSDKTVDEVAIDILALAAKEEK
jgi:hypothetical protein